MFRNYFTQHQSPTATVGRALPDTPRRAYWAQPRVPPFDWYVNRAVHGECIDVLGRFPAGSIDCIITDPPYLTNFVDRTGRSFKNDNPNDGQWLLPAYQQMYRVLKQNSFCISFYGYTRAEWFLWAWREAGFRIEEHLSFIKAYPSSTGQVARHHEQAYVLSKGKPKAHATIRSVIEFPYSGNKYHPSQKPLEALLPLVSAFSKPQDIICDPFMGSASTCVAARELDRRFIGIELDRTYYDIAVQRLQGQRTDGYQRTQYR
jgi:adenine-specific DNA-methyltransferase